MAIRVRDKGRDTKNKASDKVAKDKARDVKPSRGEPVKERFAGITRFIRETRSELKKVVWPTREAVTNLTLMVVAVSAAVAAFLGFVDLGFRKVFELLLGS